MGDVIACLPTIKELGGGDIILCPSIGKEHGRETLKGARGDALRPLLEAQPYIGKVTWQDDPKEFTHDFRNFRHDYQMGESLLEWQGRHVGVTPSQAPWLTALRSPVSLGRTVIARSVRYRNPQFPWNIILHKHRTCLFVGTEAEHIDFQRNIGPAEYCPTKDLLELAQVIAGAHLFVGNQSCPFWVAAGVGVQIIQEGWAHSPNSQVKRPNARYLIRGPFTL